MNRIRPPSPAASRHGYVLMELIVSLGLIAVAATLATRLMANVLTTGQNVSDTQRLTAAIDRAASTLRRDVEKATRVADAGGRITLRGAAAGDAAAVTWAVEDDTLVRTAGGHDERFGPLPATPVLRVEGGIVTLTIGDARWTLRPVLSSLEPTAALPGSGQ